MLERITFGLAFAAYLLFCSQMILHLSGLGPRWLTAILAAV
jgi:hypothetical protein